MALAISEEMVSWRISGGEGVANIGWLKRNIHLNERRRKSSP
jgi:hypothetical protein